MTRDRLLEQRSRSRIMDALRSPAAGEDGIGHDGGVTWRAAVLGWVDDDAPWAWRSWSVFTVAEVDLLTAVQTAVMISQGEVATLDDDRLVASGWPWRIGQLAAPALHVMNARGRFSDEALEMEPSRAYVDLHDKEHAPAAAIEIPADEVVSTTVVCRHPFGLGVWVADHDQFGHVDVPRISDRQMRGPEDFPPIGARIPARTIGYSGSGQLRLTARRSDLPGLTDRGVALVRQIAEVVGVDVDVNDEHSRWRLYWKAVPREDLRGLLKVLAAEGEDLSRHVVTEVLKYVDTAEGRTWVDLLGPGEGRDFAERRLREWELIREVVEEPRRIADDLPDLSLWCQRRLVERASSSPVLADLAEHGTARKVRHTAREKLRGRWKGWL